MRQKITWRPNRIRHLWEGKSWALHSFVVKHYIFCPNLFKTPYSLRLSFSASFVFFLLLFFNLQLQQEKQRTFGLAWPHRKGDTGLRFLVQKQERGVSGKCQTPAWLWKERRASLFASVLKGLAATTAFFFFVSLVYKAQTYPLREQGVSLPGRQCRAVLECWGWLGHGEPIRGGSGWSELRQSVVLPAHACVLGDHRYCQTGLQGLIVQENAWACCSEQSNRLTSQVKPIFLEFVL